MKTLTILLLLCSASLGLAALKSPIRNGTLETPLDGAGQSITNLGSLSVTNLLDAATGLPLSTGGAGGMAVAAGTNLAATTNGSLVTLSATTDAAAVTAIARANTNGLQGALGFEPLPLHGTADAALSVPWSGVSDSTNGVKSVLSNSPYLYMPEIRGGNFWGDPLDEFSPPPLIMSIIDAVVLPNLETGNQGNIMMWDGNFNGPPVNPAVGEVRQSPLTVHDHALWLTNSATNLVVGGTITGNGSGLTNLQAGNIFGTLTSNQIASVDVSQVAGLGTLGGGSQTPWTSDIDAANYGLTNLNRLAFRLQPAGVTVGGLTWPAMATNQGVDALRIFNSGGYAFCLGANSDQAGQPAGTTNFEASFGENIAASGNRLDMKKPSLGWCWNDCIDYFDGPGMMLKLVGYGTNGASSTPFYLSMSRSNAAISSFSLNGPLNFQSALGGTVWAGIYSDSLYSKIGIKSQDSSGRTRCYLFPGDRAVWLNYDRVNDNSYLVIDSPPNYNRYAKFYSGGYDIGTWVGTPANSSNLVLTAASGTIIVQTNLQVSGALTATNGLVLPQLTAIPTNALAQAGCVATATVTNWGEINLTNTINGGGRQYWATNTVNGGWVWQKPAVTSGTYP